MCIPVNDSSLKEEEYLGFETDVCRISFGVGCREEDKLTNTVTIWPHADKNDSDFVEFRISGTGRALTVKVRQKGTRIKLKV